MRARGGLEDREGSGSELMFFNDGDLVFTISCTLG